MDPKPAEILDVKLPNNYAALPKHQKCKVERGIVERLNETLLKAYAVAESNVLSATERQARAFSYADMIEEGLNSLVPQVINYIKNNDVAEVEYETENAGLRGTTTCTRILKGQIRRKHIFLESVSRIAEKHAKLIKDLGTAPDLPGGGGTLFKQEIHNYGDVDPQDDWEKYKNQAVSADASPEE